MHELARAQVQMDAEGETIERGSRAFTRPAGEPSMLVGTLIVLGWFALLAFAVAVLPEPSTKGAGRANNPSGQIR